MSSKYENLRDLLQLGVPVYPALQSCGISHVSAAQRWAYRHKDVWLMEQLRAAYNIEKAVRDRAWYARKKERSNA